MGFRSHFQKTWQQQRVLKFSLALILVTGLSVVWHLHSTSSQGVDSSIGTLELRTLEGERLRLQDMQGKPILLSFWSTSCGICLEEMPEMNRLNQALDAAGARLLSVTMPYDPPNHVLELAEALHIEFPVALDLDGSVSAAFSTPGTPFKVLLAKNGDIAQTFTGRLNYEKTLESVTSLLSTP